MSTRIKTITPKTFQGKVTGYTVELEDGTSGNLDGKGSDKDLKQGEEVNCIVTDYVSKAGNHSNLLLIKRAGSAPSTTPPASSHAPTLPVKAPNTVNAAQMKFDARIKCMELAHDAYVAGKLDNEESKTHAREWVTLADDLINDIFKG